MLESSPWNARALTGGKIAILCVLVIANLVTQSSRASLNFVIYPDLGVEIGILGFEYGILSGLGFSIVLFLCLIPFGRAADDLWIGRRTMISLGFVVQIVFCALQAIAWDFWSLLFIRCGLALGQAAITASSIAIITSIISDDGNSLGIGIFGTGLYFGTGVASFAAVLSYLYGWQTTFGLYGILCGVAALAVMVLPGEDVLQDNGRWNSVDTSMFLMWFTNINPLLLTLAGSLRIATWFCIAAFLPIYFQRFVVEDPNAVPAISIWYGGITLVAGCISILLGSFLSDFMLLKLRWHCAPAHIAGIGSILAIPFLLLMFYARVETVVVLVFLFFSLLVGEVWLCPAASIAQALLPFNLRTTGFVIYLTLCSLIGSLLPVLVGVLVDFGLPLRHVLACVLSVTYGLSGILFIALGLLNSTTGYRKLWDEEVLEPDDDPVDIEDSEEPAETQNTTSYQNPVHVPEEQERIMV